MSLPDNDSEAETKPPNSMAGKAIKAMIEWGSSSKEGGGRGEYENARARYGYRCKQAEHTHTQSYLFLLPRILRCV